MTNVVAGLLDVLDVFGVEALVGFAVVLEDGGVEPLLMLREQVTH